MRGRMRGVHSEYKIRHLPLSQRAINLCELSGIETVGDVRQRTDDALLRIPNLGRKILNELRAATRIDGDLWEFETESEWRDRVEKNLIRMNQKISRLWARQSNIIKRLDNKIE